MTCCPLPPHFRFLNLSFSGTGTILTWTIPIRILTKYIRTLTIYIRTWTKYIRTWTIYIRAWTTLCLYFVVGYNSLCFVFGQESRVAKILLMGVEGRRRNVVEGFERRLRPLPLVGWAVSKGAEILNGIQQYYTYTSAS